MSQNQPPTLPPPIEPEQTPEPSGESELAWQQRAQTAEAKLTELQEQLAQVETTLSQTREAIDATERKYETERALTRAGAIDLETALLLTEAAVCDMPEADVQAAVAELKKRKPFLFKQTRSASAMSSAIDHNESSVVDQAAGDARVTGDRKALLKYLRIKRTG